MFSLLIEYAWIDTYQKKKYSLIVLCHYTYPAVILQHTNAIDVKFISIVMHG